MAARSVPLWRRRSDGIVLLIVIWLFGIVIGWIRFVLRTVAWIVVIGLLAAGYLAVKAPDD